MNIKYILKIAFSGLLANKGRSLLTLLGIVIGIVAIILVMSVGKGAQNLILDEIKGIGSKVIIIKPGRQPKGPSDFASIFSNSLKKREVEALKNKSNVRGLSEIAPMVMVPGTVSHERETYYSDNIGASELFSRILKIFPEKGEFFNDYDIKKMARVAVIGAKVKDELFGNANAIGENIKIGNKNFKVVALLPRKGQVSMFDVDKIVIIPYTTAQKYLLGTDYYNTLIVEAETEDVVPQTANDIKLTLRELHHITDPDKDDFYISTQADMIQRVKLITGILSALLVSIAAISLIVGGIGIMNIMLVSVSERTREIGLRKAIGATKNNILIQFLCEAIILTGVGGIIGILLGSLFSFVASFILSRALAVNWVFTISIRAIFLGLTVSGAIGLIFGIYPANQASKKSPIEALRSE